MAAVLGPDDMRRVQRVVGELEKAGAGGRSLGRVMDDLPNTLMQYAARVVAARAGAQAGQGTSGASLLTANLASQRMRDFLHGLTNDKAAQILRDAIQDPELFRDLLMADLSKPKPAARAERRLNEWLGAQVGITAAGEGAPETAPEPREKPQGWWSSDPVIDGQAAPSAPSPSPVGPPERRSDAAGARVQPASYRGERLRIEDWSRPNFAYGKSATASARPFAGIVIHHTADKPIENLVRYGQRVDSERGGAFGYHFYIGKDGRIIQGAPLDKRTNQIKPPKHGQRKRGVAADLSNANALGITLVGAEKGATPAQLAAAERLARGLMQGFGIAPDRIFGHGELQRDRQHREGSDLVSILRAQRRRAA